MATDPTQVLIEQLQSENDEFERRKQKNLQRIAMLREIQAEQNRAQASLPMGDPQSEATPLSVFLRKALGAGKAYTAGELGSMAAREGLINGEKSPGRSVHFALVGMSQHGYVGRHEDGLRWVIKTKGH
jgi:hypothetical protein